VLPPFDELFNPVCLLSRGYKSVILGPHTGHRLADGTKGVLHCASSDGVSVFGKASITVADGKDKEVLDGVHDMSEEGVDGVFQTKVLPDIPGVVSGSGSLRNDTGSTRFLRKAEISAECISGRRWHSRQGRSCGYICSNFKRNASSERCQRREASSAMGFEEPGM